MLATIRPALVMLMSMTVLTGVLYPLTVTGIASFLFPEQAAGSLVRHGDRIVGSALLAQAFTTDRYFWPRPSAAGKGYDAAASSGSNLGPTSKVQVEIVSGRVEALRGSRADTAVPIELVTASGSGLDPHLSPAAVDYQVPRVARARGLSEDAVRRLVAAHTMGRTFGLLGEARVNVLELNLALDENGPNGRGRIP